MKTPIGIPRIAPIRKPQATDPASQPIRMQSTITAAVVPIRVEPAAARLSLWVGFGVGVGSIRAASIAELVTPKSGQPAGKSVDFVAAIAITLQPLYSALQRPIIETTARFPTRGNTLSENAVSLHDTPPASGRTVRHLLERVRSGLPNGSTLPATQWRRRHTAILSLLWLHAPAIALFGLARGVGVRHSLLEGGIVAFVALAATATGRYSTNRHLLATIVALGLLTASATIVHLSNGAIEAHFHFFVMMSVLLLYEDWLPYAAAFGYVVIHHGTVGIFSAGSVYNHQAALDHPWRWAAIHGFFITAAGIANIVNWRLNETARLEALAASHRADLSDVRFAAAFDNAPIGVALVAPDGRWLDMNQALVRILGYSREELLTMDFQRITHPDDLEGDLDQVRRVLAGEIHAYALEKRYIHAGGRVIWAQLDVSLVRDSAGEPMYFISQIQDITNRRQLEEQFRQSQKMDAVGRLAGGVAHDFNNLLTVIAGYSELALHRVTGGGLPAESDDVRDELEEIKNATARAASLTQQLLAFSRQQVVRPDRLDLNEIVDAIEKMLHRLIGEHIALTVTLDPAAGTVLADAGQLEQVILNLAVNARDAMPEGGTLTIATTAVELEQALDGEHGRVEPGRYVLLTVADDGAGMDAETQARMFEPFFTTKEPGKGTGLGLSTVYGILEQSGAQVRIASFPDEGTSFEIYLPEAEPNATAEAASPAVPAAGGTEVILIVEDQEAVRELARRMLEKHGYEVLTAANGADALQLCTDDAVRLDLIVTDVVMPHMRGEELARRVAHIRPGLRVLFMSGYAGNSIDGDEASVPFLQKPFTLGELLSAVRAALEAPERDTTSEELAIH